MSHSKYYTDPIVREKIDHILENCRTLFSNLGTSTKFDVKDIKIAKEQESKWLEEIKILDPVHYELLVPKDLDEQEG
jgi:hypothetical protein